MSTPENPRPAFGAATGYMPAVNAAVAVGLAGEPLMRFSPEKMTLAREAKMVDGAVYSEVAAKILAAEVLRLRVILDDCADEIEVQEWWEHEERCGYADRFKRNTSLREKCRAAQAYNDKAEWTAKHGSEGVK